MSSRISKVLDSFNEKEPNIQSDIIDDFSAAFKSKTSLSVKVLLENIDKRFGLGWDVYIQEVNNFDVSNGYEEEALDYLFMRFQSNTKFDEIFAKVIMINNLYSTRLNNYPVGNTISTKEMADHIKSLGEKIDNDMITPKDAVLQIGDKSKYTTIGRDVNSAYSFASKYMSFTYRSRKEKRDSVPITDTYSRNALGCLKYVKKKIDLDCYEEYFRVMNDLTDLYKCYGSPKGFKEIDAFLWIMGKAFSTS